MAEYRVFLRTTTQAINAEFDKYSADKLNIRIDKAGLKKGV